MRRTLFFAFATTVALLLLAGCDSKAKIEARMEKPVPASAQATPQQAPAPAPKLPPPTQAELAAAWHRVFDDDLVADLGNHQAYILGDFNGDESEDIALIARPAPGKLQDINSELANWTIQDADAYFVPKGDKTVIKPPEMQRPKVANGEEILAVIHGVGPNGWRSPDARQAYIVKHAAATLLGTAPSISQKAIRAMKLPVETDIIKEVRNNKKGFLFWTGGAYAWHPSEG